MSNEETPTYIPRPEFRAELESEVMRAYRRNALARSWTRRRAWWRAAAIVIVSLGVGTTAGLASAQIARSSERDSLLESARADAMLATMRRDLARAQADDVNQKVRLGIEGEQAQTRANAELRVMEMQLGRVGLNIEEIKASGHAPRDDLNAPVIGGRDFVKQRIEAEAAGVQQQLTAAEGNLALVERRVRAGAGSEVERLSANLEVTKLRATMAILVRKLELRAEFVAKGTPVDDLARRLDRGQLQQDMVVAQTELALARARVSIVEKQRSVGMVDEAALLRAQLDVTERLIQLTRLTARLRGLPPM
jgi:hypothetical protein